MKYMIKETLALVILLIFTANTFACSNARKGSNYKSHNELIDQTNQIVIAEFKELNGKPMLIVHETIKGNKTKTVTPPYLLRTYLRVARHLPYNNNDFNNHTDKTFWNREKSRINGWESGSCWPTFTFYKNHKYLIFVDSYASKYSAELINNKKDMWYLYVKQRVKKS